MISRHPVRRPDRRRPHRLLPGGRWIPHPTYDEGDDSTFELVVAGRELDDGDVAVMMVEAGGTEKTFDYYEAGAPRSPRTSSPAGSRPARSGSRSRSPCSASSSPRSIAATARSTPLEFTPSLDYGDDVFDAVERVGHAELVARPCTIAGKAERNAATDAVKAEPLAELAGTADEPGEFAGREKEIKEAVRSLTKKLVRKRIVEEGVRIDGRGLTDLRPVSAEVGVLPTAHGSGLFQRGETQVLNVLHPGHAPHEPALDTLTPETTKRYLHHYNMPPWANGETGRVGSPEAPRDRPRRARRAGPAAGRARARRSSPTRCASSPRC